MIRQMRKAILVTGLKTTEVLCGREARYRVFEPLPLFATDGAMLHPTETIDVQERIVPVTEIWKNGNPILYVAYTHEVEELLQVPINCIIAEKRRCQERADSLQLKVNRLEGMTPYQHIKSALSKFLWKIRKRKWRGI